MKSILSITSFLLIISYSNAQVPNYVPSDSLIGWWGFNGNANDESGNSLNGQTFSTVLTNDRFFNQNSSYDFNGSDAYIEIPPNNFLIGPTTSLTVSAWFIANTSLGTRAIFTHRDIMSANSTNIYGIWLQDNNLLYSEVNGDSTSVPLILVDSVQASVGNWHNFVLVVKDQEINHYLNGIKVATLYGQAGNIDLRNRLARIGRHRDLSSNVQYFSGKIDDIGIWNRALDSCEIIDLYNASVNCTAGLSNQSTSKLKIYPNPTNNLIQIEIDNHNGSFEAELYDFTGKLLETTNSTSLSLADYPTGIYLLKVAYSDRTEEVKVVKE